MFPRFKVEFFGNTVLKAKKTKKYKIPDQGKFHNPIPIPDQMLVSVNRQGEAFRAYSDYLASAPPAPFQPKTKRKHNTNAPPNAAQTEAAQPDAEEPIQEAAQQQLDITVENPAPKRRRRRRRQTRKQPSLGLRDEEEEENRPSPRGHTPPPSPPPHGQDQAQYQLPYQLPPGLSPHTPPPSPPPHGQDQALDQLPPSLSPHTPSDTPPSDPILPHSPPFKSTPSYSSIRSPMPPVLFSPIQNEPIVEEAATVDFFHEINQQQHGFNPFGSNFSISMPSS